MYFIYTSNVMNVMKLPHLAISFLGGSKEIERELEAKLSAIFTCRGMPRI